MTSLADVMNATAEGRHALAAARLRYALRRRRWQLGLSQQQVADAMGYAGTARGVVCDWEVGRRTPQLTSLIAWCEALGTKLTISIDDETEVADG